METEATGALKQMLACYGFVAGTFAAGLFFPTAWIGTAIGVLPLWYFLYRAAAERVDRSYALRHLLLSIFLTPLLAVGILLIPLAVASDIRKWERARAGDGPLTDEEARASVE